MAELNKPSDPLKEPSLLGYQSNGWQVNGKTYSWSPPTDVFKTTARYIIKIEIAGMKQSDIDVNFEENSLIISGTRSESREKRAYHQMEIRFGQFRTIISLPEGLSLDSAEAEYEDGFLTVSIPYIKATTIKIKG
jgi:HSP20 family protein